MYIYCCLSLHKLFVMWCAGIGLGSLSVSISYLQSVEELIFKTSPHSLHPIRWCKHYIVNVVVGKAAPKVICEDCILLHVLLVMSLVKSEGERSESVVESGGV
jgi:hypothetical protein